MSTNYIVNCDLKVLHSNFNDECVVIDKNFKNNKLMQSIVQNCSTYYGFLHLNYIKNNYSEIYEKINFDLLREYDLIGGQGSEELINNVSPKVISYIREALFYYSNYLKPKNIHTINNLLIIGGGYGMEAVILHYICSLLDVKINSIIGIDMPNVANLQNTFFKLTNMNSICKSYSPETIFTDIDYVYSNCCLAELTPDINLNYYNNIMLNSKGFFLIWGLWAAEIPNYYKEYIADNKLISLLNDGLAPNTNCLFAK